MEAEGSRSNEPELNWQVLAPGFLPVSHSSLQRSTAFSFLAGFTSFRDTQLAASTSIPPSAAASPALLYGPTVRNESLFSPGSKRAASSV